ncbi:MAG: Omp28 family outer membrane lipoprotein [Prevotella sp.]|nr:Omp28 family outer membrane lipoprotein [Prevotella sp.]MCM1075192.1 Omp28 family outer membrane lipoprotein [Ruminococcus sp.]
MKYTSILSAAALALTLCACDNIDEQDRLIPVEFHKSDKVVLIEEFTGSRCANCPTGAATITALHENPVFGERIIPVALYPSQLQSLTRPYSGQKDLRTQVASDIFAKYNTRNALPAAMFNRRTFEGEVLKTTVSTWSGFVSTLIDEKDVAPVNITLDCAYDQASRQLTVAYQTQFVATVSQDVSFQVYILENGIITKQATPTGEEPAYVNNHVLRTALNGTWGDSYGADHAAGTFFDDSRSITLNGDWVPENIQVVGFLCNTEGNHEVLHAAIIESITDKTK